MRMKQCIQQVSIRDQRALFAGALFGMTVPHNEPAVLKRDFKDFPSGRNTNQAGAKPARIPNGPYGLALESRSFGALLTTISTHT
jgi:hypothetical protein